MDSPDENVRVLFFSNHKIILFFLLVFSLHNFVEFFVVEHKENRGCEDESNVWILAEAFLSKKTNNFFSPLSF